MPTGTLTYSSGHLVPSIWDLHMYYLLRPILFPNLSLFFRTKLFEYPSVLSRFCFAPTVRPKSIRNRRVIGLLVASLCSTVCCLRICVILRQISFLFSFDKNDHQKKQYIIREGYTIYRVIILRMSKSELIHIFTLIASFQHFVL